MKKGLKGLSLMEVMVTLVIVAIIAGVSYPSYQRMVARSKQTEVKTVLQSIYIGEDLYFTTNQTYTENLDELDIQVPKNAKYTYSISVGESGNSFIAKGYANIDSDEVLDEWQIDQENNLVNVINDAIEE